MVISLLVVVVDFGSMVVAVGLWLVAAVGSGLCGLVCFVFALVLLSECLVCCYCLWVCLLLCR